MQPPIFFLKLISWATAGIAEPWPEGQPKEPWPVCHKLYHIVSYRLCQYWCLSYCELLWIALIGVYRYRQLSRAYRIVSYRSKLGHALGVYRERSWVGR